MEAKEDQIVEIDEKEAREEDMEETIESTSKKHRIKSKTAKIIGIVALIIVGAILFNFVLMPLTDFIPRVTGEVTYDTSNPHIVFENGVKISAHRAGGSLAPEETLRAFKTCVEATDYNVEILEFDLHITKDGHLVLLHDHTINRTSNATEHFGEDDIHVMDKTLEELKELNCGENFCDLNGESPFKGLRGDDIPDDVRILALEELLDYLQEVGADLDFIIEIKDGGEDGERAMDILYDTLVRYNIVERTIVGTFQDNVTKYIDETYPQVTRSASIAEVLHFYPGQDLTQVPGILPQIVVIIRRNAVGLHAQALGNVYSPVQMILLGHDDDLLCLENIPCPVQTLIGGETGVIHKHIRRIDP